MGADLTIVKDGTYFRDSYNETNILWRFNLHYWGLDEEIPIGKIKRTMSYKQASILKAEIEKRKPIAEAFYKTVDENWLKEHHCEEGVAKWVDFWRKKQDKFIKFLTHAVELKSGIRWSV